MKKKKEPKVIIEFVKDEAVDFAEFVEEVLSWQENEKR